MEALSGVGKTTVVSCAVREPFEAPIASLLATAKAVFVGDVLGVREEKY